MTYKLKFRNDGVIIQKQEVEPFTGSALTVDLKTLKYSELQSMSSIIIEVNSITPEIDDGVLKSLEMVFTTGKEISEKPIVTPAQSRIEEKVPSVKTIPIRTHREDEILFEDLLTSIQRNKLDELIQRIVDIGDPKIKIESHRQHVAIKHLVGRSKAWLVCKKSGRNLFLWLRAGPDISNPRNIANSCNDISMTHGNYRVELMSSDIEDVMNIVNQSYEYRTRIGYYSDYEKQVRGNEK